MIICLVCSSSIVSNVGNLDTNYCSLKQIRRLNRIAQCLSCELPLAMIDELINSELFSVKNMKYRVGWTGKPSNCKNRENFGYFKKWNTSGRFKW